MTEEELHLRALQPGDFNQMYRTFVDAFSNYIVKMDISKEAFRDRVSLKLRINYELSVGAFHGEKLVGFIFNTINNYEGRRTAYNGGTGVLRDYWGRSLTQSMYEFLIPKLKRNGVERCLLEVITTNEKGVRAYQKTGFAKTKVFKCFKLKQFSTAIRNKENWKVFENTKKELSAHQDIADVSPSMLDSFEHLPGSLENERILEIREKDKLLGYIIFKPGNGRISQIAVAASQRRKGIGQQLIKHAFEQSGNAPLTILNIDAKEKGFVSFLKGVGFVNEIDQYEMELVL